MKTISMLTVFTAVAMTAATTMLCLTGCDDGDDGGGTPANIAGTWTGTYTIEGYGSVQTIVNLTQDGGNVSGNAGGGGSIRVSGTVDGNKVALVFAFSSGTTDTVEGSVKDNAMNLSGSSEPYGWTVRWNLTRSGNKMLSENNKGEDIEAFVREAIMHFGNKQRDE